MTASDLRGDRDDRPAHISSGSSDRAHHRRGRHARKHRMTRRPHPAPVKHQPRLRHPGSRLRQRGTRKGSTRGAHWTVGGLDLRAVFEWRSEFRSRPTFLVLRRYLRARSSLRCCTNAKTGTFINKRCPLSLVEMRGFEPLAPSMRTRCATGLRHIPSWTGQR